MYFLKFFLCSAIIIVYLNLHYSSVILRNLTSEGGVESNPGPWLFAIRKVVQASHHQGDIRYRSDSAGKQCTANAYFAIIFWSIERISLWKSFDLDYVLEQGDKSFKKVCEDRKLYEYLAVDELPLNFSLEGTNVSAGRLANESLLLAEKNNLFLLNGRFFIIWVCVSAWARMVALMVLFVLLSSFITSAPLYLFDRV